MAKILGTNALVYIGGQEFPQRNSWSLSVERELREARVFQPGSAAASWVENAGSFRSWSGSIGGYYDDVNEVGVQNTVGSVTRTTLHLYENRNTLTRYWYGWAWFSLSEDVSAEDFIELSVDFTGDGPLMRFAS
jgi:hypothetical protein